MPNIVGLSYAVAYEEISSAGRHLDYIDVLEKRSVWDNENWVVVQQIPEPGTKVSQVEKICAGVTKIAEKWRTPQHFGCWSEVYSDVKPVSISRDVMSLDIDFSNSHDNGHQYRATVEINTDDGETLKVMYCTEEATAPGGKVGRMRLSGKYFVDDAVIFNNYVGRFAYSISKLESQLGNIPC
jgi:beta-lactam-binding protein with PASTA domain